MTVDDLVASVRVLIADGGYKFLKPETKGYVAKCAFNDQLAVYKATDDEIDRELAFERLITAYGAVRFGGMDPKLVPSTLLRYFQENPVEIVTGNELKYRDKVRNPNTGIRAKCITCMGGSVNEVRHCPTLNCPLWPFRLGGNPFFGRLTDIDTDAEVEEEEHAD